MNLRREDKKRLPSRNPQLLAAPSCANVYGSREEVLEFYLFRHLTQLKEITGNLYYWMVLTWGGLQLDL